MIHNYKLIELPEHEYKCSICKKEDAMYCYKRKKKEIFVCFWCHSEIVTSMKKVLAL